MPLNELISKLVLGGRWLSDSSFMPSLGNSHTEGTLTPLSLISLLPLPLVACERAGGFPLPEWSQNERNQKKKWEDGFFYYYHRNGPYGIVSQFYRLIFLLENEGLFLTGCQAESPSRKNHLRFGI